jgi:hypothetical protein
MTTIKQALADISNKLEAIAQAVQAKPNVDHITAVSNDVLDVKTAVNAIASSIGNDPSSSAPVPQGPQ